MIYKKIIKNPLEKLTLGKIKKTTYYLTANIFYSGVHFAVRKKIVDTVKLYLKSELRDCPLITKPISISIGYQTNKNTTFDLDNKSYFWSKVICDVLQEMNKLPDDSVKFIQQIHYFYKRGDSELIFQINEL
tara:strand:+ start:846 stop:1241 length:396 start_codon:yes stop_codon:yes gene_type:complete